MNIIKEKKLLKLALSKKKDPEKIKNKVIEILMEDVTPMDVIANLSEQKTKWSSVPLRPKVELSKYSISKALQEKI